MRQKPAHRSVNMSAPEAVYSVVIVTASPPTQSSEAGGPFVKVDGRESLLRSVELFLNRDNVKQIQLVINPDDIEEAKRKFGAHLGLMGVKLTAGGPKWNDQVAAAGKNISPEATHVILHDAARPAVPFSDIDALMECAAQNAVVMLTSPVRAQLVELDEGHNPVAFHVPTNYLQLLTPQAFSKEKFAQLASGTEIHASEAKLVKGSPLNVRVGSSADERVTKAMLNMLPKPKVKAPSNPFEEAQW
jgi:2-C-methyl-D-erythritol 4-phosphate cytidylyltransferase